MWLLWMDLHKEKILTFESKHMIKLRVIMTGSSIIVFHANHCCPSAAVMTRYLSTVLSEELRSVYFATELLCLCEHLWELRIEDLLFTVLCC